ncbi:hypothetical protein PAEN110709_01745 [Paenibacillus endophyticus]
MRSQIAYLRGDIIGPFGTLFEGTELVALYVTTPVYFPDSFHTYDTTNDISIVQAWLVPITLNEASYVKENGWEAFEDKLEELDPDLKNYKRVCSIS